MKVKVENWIDGVLEVSEEFFDHYLSAHKRVGELHHHHSHHSDNHVIKLYDDDDTIMHSVNSPDYSGNTYA